MLTTDHHERQDGFQHEVSTLQVHVELRVPDLFIHGGRVAGLRAADIVHQHVDAAEPIETGLHHRGRVGGRGHVASAHRHLAAFAFDDAPGLVRGVEIEVHAEHPGALPREQHRDRLAIAPARPDGTATGDQHHLAIQPEGGFRPRFTAHYACLPCRAGLVVPQPSAGSFPVCSRHTTRYRGTRLQPPRTGRARALPSRDPPLAWGTWHSIAASAPGHVEPLGRIEA